MSLPVREQVENPENLRETLLKTRPVMKSGYFDLLHSRDIWLFSTAIALAVAWPWVTEPALGQPMTQDGPPVHFRLDRNYYTIETNARVRVERRTQTGVLTVTLTLRNPGHKHGALISATHRIPAGERRDDIWPLDITPLEHGTHSLTLQVIDDRGNPYGPIELALTKHPPAEHEVKYDWDNNILVDGKPFFPIGYLGSSIKDVAFKKRQGFNCVVEWPFPSRWDEKDWLTDQLLAEARKADLRVVLTGPFNRHGPAKWGWIDPATRITRAKRGAERYKTHPALLCYFTQDEPHYTPESHQELKTMYQEIRSRDPYYPVFVNHWWTGPDARFTGVSDWVGKDLYPVYGGCFTQLEEHGQKAFDLMGNRKPFVFIPQAWSHPTSRHPSQLELRHMVYLMVIHGAKAVLFYQSPPWPFFIRLNGELVRELDQISPVLLSDFPEVIRPISEEKLDREIPASSIVMPLVYKYPKDRPMIAAAVWRNGHNVWVIATNRQTSRVRAELEVAELTGGCVRVLNEDRRIPLSQGRWTDEFGPIATHIYQLRSEREDAE